MLHALLCHNTSAIYLAVFHAKPFALRRPIIPAFSHPHPPPITALLPFHKKSDHTSTSASCTHHVPSFQLGLLHFPSISPRPSPSTSSTTPLYMWLRSGPPWASNLPPRHFQFAGKRSPSSGTQISHVIASSSSPPLPPRPHPISLLCSLQHRTRLDVSSLHPNHGSGYIVLCSR